MKRKFNEDTRVKIPATLQLLRIGYNYQSLKDADIDFNTKIVVNRFKAAIEKINKRTLSDSELQGLLMDIHTLMRNNDLGRSFYKRLISQTDDIKLLDFDNIQNNDFAVIDELPFTINRETEEGSFRPDINILINGMPLAFLEVKKPNNENGIQAEFKRMINERLQKPEFKKFFNFIQIVSFSNNMEYENGDNVQAELVKAGSFYTTPNGQKTSFSFFREDEKGYLDNYSYKVLDDDYCKEIVEDLGYDKSHFDTPEFTTNNTVYTPCNRFITSFYDKERLMYFLQFGFLYVDGEIPEKHIMRYPQFFATRAILKRLEAGDKRGIIWHTQGSGKTELSAYTNKILHNYYAKKDIQTRFFFVVDRLDLLRQDNDEFSSRYFKATNCTDKQDFSKQLGISIPKIGDAEGEFVVVNIQKFEKAIPKAQNLYNTDVQRVFFIDECHRSYALNGEYFKNLILCDPNAIFIALTGTPLLSKKERSNLKFGDYIHKYFYDKSIADGYTLRIKKEKVDTLVRQQIKDNLEVEDPDLNSADIFESEPYIKSLGEYIEKDFRNFRVVNEDDTIGGMIVCRSNEQAKRVHEWFKNNSKLKTGLVISDTDNPEQQEANFNNQKEFKHSLTPDILVVHYMLTVGYDVKRLKKMYLLRGPKAQSLLQTISRVNRPYRSPKTGKIYNYGYITDFVDIEEEYDRTLNDYLKELEQDMVDPDDADSKGNLNGLLVDVETIVDNYKKSKSEAESMISTDNDEEYSQKLTLYTKDALLKIKRLLNNMKTCYVELLLSNANDEALAIDIEQIKRRIRLTQERIDFINIKDDPVRMIDMISDKDIVEIFYEFIRTSISIIDLSGFDPTSASYKKFTDAITEVQKEIKMNKNKRDIKIIKLDEILHKLFSSMDIQNMDDLDNLTDEMIEILTKARKINAENERLAAIYDGNYAMVKTYQDAFAEHTELSNLDIQEAVKIIYNEIKDVIDSDVLAIQGRQGFIDETKKKIIKPLLVSKLYKKLNLKDWLTELLTQMYTNLQNY